MKWKAISLWEPWASAIRVGAKRWETRSWPVAYRGELVICAAKKTDDALLLSLLADRKWQDSLRPLRPAGDVVRADLHFGKAVALCDLTDCVLTDILMARQILRDQLHLGDFSSGRYAWKLENIRPIVPFAVRGKQGLFDLEADTALTFQIPQPND